MMKFTVYHGTDCLFQEIDLTTEGIKLIGVDAFITGCVLFLWKE